MQCGLLSSLGGRQATIPNLKGVHAMVTLCGFCRRLFNDIKSTMSRQMAVSLNPAERTGRLLLLRGLLLRLQVSALALVKLSQ